MSWVFPAMRGASLEFYIKHIGLDSGSKLVNQSISYSDAEGNVVVFPEPSVMVDCDIVIRPEPCPVPVEFDIEGCKDSVILDLGDTYIDSLGRIVQLDVTVKDVCPKKRVALAVILTELDANGIEYPRGTKAITIPAHRSIGCRDVLVKCIKFVLPEDLAVSGGARNSLCNKRNFKVRFLANYIDSDYVCCDSVVTRL